MIIDRVIEWWLKRCHHADHHVAADILEGGSDVEVKYCRRCGAVRPSYTSEWRRPRPLWFA
jgi:NMD protein affecting ribosome stability and mRNA decay